jgi:ribosomal protein S12 methylthiotransferase
VSRKPPASQEPPRNFVAVVSLGCPKNQIDSENLLGQLAGRDVVICPDPADASVIIVNTCGFIAPAREEGAEVLEECLELKRTGSCRLLAVAGCWVERDETDLRKRFPEVDLWVGLLTPESITRVTQRVLGGRVGATRRGHEGDISATELPHECRVLAKDVERIRLTPGHFCYLRIADGCDNRCAYCTIPEIRGPLRSKPRDAVLEEAQLLAAEEVKEINLVAQDITAYGCDLGGKPQLLGLLRDMAKIDGIDWIRLLYAHPAHFTDELIDLIVSEAKVCSYVDLPIQHISERILALMGRKVTRSQIESLIAALRKSVPGIVLRTTVLVGFPGETEREFAELCDFLTDIRFERLGCFPYSPERATPAADLPGDLSDAERRRRADQIMQRQQHIAFDIARSWVGRQVPVIVDRHGEEPGQFVGRTYGDAPDIDPVIFLSGEIAVGEITTAGVTEARGYDLVGVA